MQGYIEWETLIGGLIGQALKWVRNSFDTTEVIEGGEWIIKE
mgnify:CR=1 FL=1